MNLLALQHTLGKTSEARTVRRSSVRGRTRSGAAAISRSRRLLNFQPDHQPWGGMSSPNTPRTKGVSSDVGTEPQTG